MKRYFIYIIMVLATLVVGCTPYATDENPQVTEIGDIEVAFSVDGEEVSRLDLASVSHNIKVDVALNNEGIYWNVVSSEEWCQIVEEEHRGSGSFTLVINANDSFDARETATVTFKAGEYEQDMLTVDHNGNVFVIEQVYTASTKSAGSFTTKIKTFDAGDNWSFECDEWITATKGAATTNAEGETITEVTISWVENTTASRYGEVKLKKNDKDYADGWINIWQYGTELNYDGDGNLLLAAQDVAPLELRVPKQTIKDIAMPSWVTYTTVENSDNTVSYMLQFAGNPSDAHHVRATELEISFLSGAASIKLPTIMQEYYVMEGLVSGPGLKIFAQTWNAGGDVSQWYVDGVPTLMGDIDLTEVEEWVSIGTDERPWTGEFNGNGKKIINLKSSQPLFGVCENATLKNIVIDETSVIEYVGEFSEQLLIASLVKELKNNSVVESCTNNGKVAIDAAAKAENIAIAAAGLVAYVDATSKVSLCSNFGEVNVPNSCTTLGDSSRSGVGGIVAYNEGIIEDCFNNGTITASAQAVESCAAGIVAANTATAIVRNNQNAGAIHFGSKKGSAASSYIGGVAGIVGVAYGEVYGNTNEGDITSSSNVQALYIGGVTALWPEECTKFENNEQANASDILAEGEPLKAYVGGIAGCVRGESVTIDYTTNLLKSAGTIDVTDMVSDLTNGLLCIGGHFGYIEGDATLNAPAWEGTLNSNFVDKDNYCPTKVGGIVAMVNGVTNITGATVAGTLKTAHRWDTKASKQVNHSMGGIVGECCDAVTIKDSNNTANITWDRASSANRVQYSSVALGGIAGRILGGNALIENCHNSSNLYNGSYNNGSYDQYAKPNVAGGIVGSFGLTKDVISETITVRNCTSKGKLRAMRGFVAGIVGWAQNATIEDCSYTTAAFENDINPHAAGIIACAYTSGSIKNCTAIVDIQVTNGGSCNPRGGGIVAIAQGVIVDGCSYFGNLTYGSAHSDPSQNGKDYLGGIIGDGDEDCIIRNCRYGGSVNTVTISANNVETYAKGIEYHSGTPCDAVVESVTYWDGK